MRRPKGIRWWTGGDVVRWIEANVKDRDSTPESLAIWWAAYNDAEALCDYRQKDLASLYVDGVKPYTLRDVSRHLQLAYEDTPIEEAREADSHVEAGLREFFGVKEAP